MTAFIYRPARGATQSGAGRTHHWTLEYGNSTPRQIEPLMGWTSSKDPLSQVRLNFETKEEAIAYCERHGIPYQVAEPKPARRHLQSYSDNFRSSRLGQWTH